MLEDTSKVFRELHPCGTAAISKRFKKSISGSHCDP
jgi:hypothetical protein